MLDLESDLRNPGGIRFGSAEIYNVLDTCFKHDTQNDPSLVVLDYLAVGRSFKSGTDERVIVFIKLLEGKTCLDDLKYRTKGEVCARRSAQAHHVPEVVRQCSYKKGGCHMIIL